MRTGYFFLTFFMLLFITHSGGAAAQQQATPTDIDSHNEEIDQSALEQGSAAQQLKRQFNLDEPGLSGLLVDRTVTIMGKTFYRDFSQLAMQSALLNRATLTFHERPDARWGSQLWITENRKVLFRTQLSPRLGDSQQMAREAMNVVEERLVEQRLSAQLMPNKDLGKEEL